MEEDRSGTNSVSIEKDSVEPISDKLKEKKGGKIKSRRNTAPASSQGYATIRTQLQNKRASINKTIGHEVELKKGASRLIRYTHVNIPGSARLSTRACQPHGATSLDQSRYGQRSQITWFYIEPILLLRCSSPFLQAINSQNQLIS